MSREDSCDVGFVCWELIAVGWNVGGEVTGVWELSTWENSLEEDRSCVQALVIMEINITAVQVSKFDKFMNGIENIYDAVSSFIKSKISVEEEDDLDF